MMIASMMRATGVLLILAGGGVYGATAADKAQLCANAPSPDAAIQQCTAAIASGGRSVADQAAALGFRCRAYSNKHDYARALPDCERAVQLAPNSALQVCRRGCARYGSGNLDGAMRLKPDGLSYYLRGWCHFQRRSYDLAKADFDEAIRLGSGAAAYYNADGAIPTRRTTPRPAIP